MAGGVAAGVERRYRAGERSPAYASLRAASHDVSASGAARGSSGAEPMRALSPRERTGEGQVCRRLEQGCS